MPSLRVRVLAHAQHLNPNDMTLNFELMNARLKELEAHVKDHQKGAADDQHIRLLRTRALNESRRLLSTPTACTPRRCTRCAASSFTS